ncbi:hypothetical protein IMZ48_45490 [Candidatus Bathyarchaeota archaeon]|nr:hypothetical protein [Candidatus Bathyarchaeota archaeon]
MRITADRRHNVAGEDSTSLLRIYYGIPLACPLPPARLDSNPRRPRADLIASQLRPGQCKTAEVSLGFEGRGFEDIPRREDDDKPFTNLLMRTGVS